ncbi:hypothetical protein WN944_003666 [Citrus x changshan-huyou]|uniref:cytokinin riboside 5'-monophosphate phosphoribohydrolase n=1 Tax=Citrus x changshan-huyou TaxID=2935761 RepID=A0AAP0LZY4_9ROSI
MAATPNTQFKNICVLSGFNYGKHKEFVKASIDLSRSIAEKKLHLVYGGGKQGLSDSPTGEELAVSGMQERIIEMLNHADTFIFLPGDLATLEALITLASWAHLHIHQKPIAKKLFICAHTANELLDLLQAYKLEPNSRTFVLESPNNNGNSSRSKKYKLDLTLRL